MIVLAVLLTILVTASAIILALNVASLSAKAKRQQALLEDVQTVLKPYDYDAFTDVKLRVGRELER
jgi:hypothetical protein